MKYSKPRVATLGQGHPRIDGERVPTDCSGYLHALFAGRCIDLFAEGRPSDNGVRAMVRFVERHGRLFRCPLAAPGDLVLLRQLVRPERRRAPHTTGSRTRAWSSRCCRTGRC